MTATTEYKPVTTFLAPIHFKCLEGCGLCCGYKVHVSDEDVERLNDFGVPRADFHHDGRMKKESDVCCFLDEKARCSVYEARPAYCRSFPFYAERTGEIDVDLSCPGIGQGEVISSETLDEMTSWCGVETVGPDPFQSVTESLPEIESADAVREAVDAWIADSVSADSFSELAASARQAGEGHGVLPPAFAKELALLSDFFEIPNGRNARLTPDNKPEVYGFDLAENRFLIDGEEVFSFGAGERDERALSQAEGARLREYLSLWNRREIFHRFCVANSLQAPGLLRPSYVAFLFMARLLERLGGVYEALRRHRASEIERLPETEILRESMGVMDGRLRTKCRAAGVQTYS